MCVLTLAGLWIYQTAPTTGTVRGTLGYEVPGGACVC